MWNSRIFTMIFAVWTELWILWFLENRVLEKVWNVWTQLMTDLISPYCLFPVLYLVSYQYQQSALVNVLRYHFQISNIISEKGYWSGHVRSAIWVYLFESGCGQLYGYQFSLQVSGKGTFQPLGMSAFWVKNESVWPVMTTYNGI